MVTGEYFISFISLRMYGLLKHLKCSSEKLTILSYGSLELNERCKIELTLFNFLFQAIFDLTLISRNIHVFPNCNKAKNLNRLSIKYRSYPKSTKINTFKQQNMCMTQTL